MMVDYTTVYATFDPLDQEKLDEMVLKVQNLASFIKESDDKGKAVAFLIMAFLGLMFFGALASDK